MTTTTRNNLPAPSNWLHWALDPNITFLNHGSFGATPKAVQAAQTRYREQLEREPVDFFVNTHWELMDKVRAALGKFTNQPADRFVPVANATVGVATALAAVDFKPGDELLMTSHEYPACQNNARRIVAQHGAKTVTAEIPFPCPSPEAITNAVLSKVTPRTRALLISHVTSPTGLVLPIEPIISALRGKVITIVDGAHAPGMVPSFLACEPDYYTANCHKWLCSPKGSAFLYTTNKNTRPTVLSNNAEYPKPNRPQFHTEFDYIGTNDCTSIYSIPDAIDYMATLVPGGWPEIIARNHALALKGRDIICNTLNIEPPAPDSMIGSISTMILPPHDPDRAARLKQRATRYHDALQDALIERHRIQAPIMSLANTPHRLFRISAQLYNSIEQYEYLAQALKEELARERTL